MSGLQELVNDDPVSNYARGSGLEVVKKDVWQHYLKSSILQLSFLLPVFALDITRDMFGVGLGGSGCQLNFRCSSITHL